MHFHPFEYSSSSLSRNVVNGLRDDDDESFYAGRSSIGSEYSTRESGENVQVYVKEHVRHGSKGSNASFAPRKRGMGNKSRPETKVCPFSVCSK